MKIFDRKWTLLRFNQFKVWFCFTFTSDVIIINGLRWKMGEIFLMNNCPGEFPRENYYRFHLYASLNGKALRKLENLQRNYFKALFESITELKKNFFIHRKALSFRLFNEFGFPYNSEPVYFFQLPIKIYSSKWYIRKYFFSMSNIKFYHFFILFQVSYSMYIHLSPSIELDRHFQRTYLKNIY